MTVVHPRARRSWRNVGAALVAGFVVLAAGCGSGGGHPTTAPDPRPGALGLLPASPDLTDRLDLDATRVVAGAGIGASLVVTNRGSTPVNINGGCVKYAVVLANPGHPPDPAFTLECSTRPVMIDPGVNRLPVSIITTYQYCPVRQRTPSTVLSCTSGVLPALPAGQYRAVLAGHGVRLPAPAPVPVTLAAP